MGPSERRWLVAAEAACWHGCFVSGAEERHPVLRFFLSSSRPLLPIPLCIGVSYLSWSPGYDTTGSNVAVQRRIAPYELASSVQLTPTLARPQGASPRAPMSAAPTSPP